MNIKSKEQNIIKQCLQGDADAQKLLYQTYADKMFAVCLRYGSSREDAEDILQEGFIKVFKSLDRFQFRGSFEGWVRRIMVNIAIMHYKKNLKWKHMKNTEEVTIASNEIGVIQSLNADDLMNLVQRLPVGYRTVFNLFVVEGYGHPEIAEMLGVSKNTSKTQLFKARAALKVMIQELNEREKQHIAI